MKKIFWLFNLFIFCFLAISCYAVSESDVRPGMRVAAKWSDGNWYMATVDSIAVNSCDVSYADGTKGSVSYNDVTLIPNDIFLRPGEKVLAVWSNARFYAGTVQSVAADGAVIQWEDGSASSKVSFGKIIKNVESIALSLGQQVSAQWSDGNWYLAKIDSVSGNTFNVTYADGEKGAVKMEEIRSIPSNMALKAGDRVLAVWSEARFYGGVVQSVDADGATIKWDDGSSPSKVFFGKIIKE